MLAILEMTWVKQEEQKWHLQKVALREIWTGARRWELHKQRVIHTASRKGQPGSAWCTKWTENLKTLFRGLLGSLFLAFQISFATFAFLYFVVLLSHDGMFTKVAPKSWGI